MPAASPPVAPPKKTAASTASANAANDAVTAAEIERINDAYETNRRLHTTNPEYQQLYERASRARARLNYAALYKALAPTPDQIEAFENLVAKHLWSGVDIP